MDAKVIEGIFCEMELTVIAGVKKNFQGTQITFDKFYVLKILNEAVNKVSREEKGFFRVEKEPIHLAKNLKNLKQREGC